MTNVLRKRAVIARTLAESANQNDDLRDLYVFGYQCKLFRDDERALFIEYGKHLIPWMGNDSLMIDRYDGRGHLYDLSEFDSDLVQSTTLSEEERHIEALCDEERYLELNTDILEKMLYEEEELKRLNEALADDNSYSAVSFDYDSSNKTAEESSTAETSQGPEYDEESRLYVPIAALQLPPHITPPKTEKMHAIIERTAAFIAQHGVQMEIMMKAKQKDNACFSFLNYEDELNAYYKHVLHAIKHSKYIPASAVQKTSADAAEEAYLHPNLSSSAEKQQQQPQQISRKEFLDSISSKLPVGQIANTPYAKLLSNLSKHNTRVNSPKPVKQADKSDLTNGSAAGEKSLPSVRSAPSLRQVTSESVSDITVSSSRVGTQNISLPPVPGLEPVALPQSSHSSSVEVSSSANENREAVSESRVVPPPPDVKLIIDKMADYVARNGPEFEIVVRRRNDERFRFVESGHPHHAYYLHKRDTFLRDMEKKKALEAQQCQAEESPENVQPQQQHSDVEKTKCEDDQSDKSLSRAVSFVIKTKEEEAPMLKTATALQCETTSDEDENDDDDDDADDGESDVASQHSSVKPGTYTASNVNGVAVPSVSLAAVSATAVRRSSSSASLKMALSSSAAETAKYPAATDTQKHGDRLTAGDRDKQTSSTAARDRQLQEQRKRKAAAFLTRMKQSDVSQTADDTATECASNTGSVIITPSMSPASVLSVRSRSRSVTPAAASLLASPASAAALVLPADRSHTVLSRKQSPGPTPAKRHKHRSPRRHRHRSRSHHRSSSRKHHKRKKKLPSAYTEIRTAAKSPAVKLKQLRDDGSHAKSSRHASSSDIKVYSSSKKRHSASTDSKRHHHRLKKHHKTKKSHRHSSSSSSSSRSPSPAKRRRVSSDNLIDLTGADKPDQSSSDNGSNQLSPATSQHSKQDKSTSVLSDVQALLEEKRLQLLKEDVVVLD